MGTYITIFVVAYILGAFFRQPVVWLLIGILCPFMWVHKQYSEWWESLDWTSKGKIIMRQRWLRWLRRRYLTKRRCDKITYREWIRRINKVIELNKAYWQMTDEEK